MSVAVITPPDPFIDLALAKKHLRVEAANTDEDDLIELNIAAACAAIDGPGGWLGRAVGLQTLELRMDSFYSQDWRLSGGWAWDGIWIDWSRWPFSRIELPFPPFVSVTSITYEDATGADQVLTTGGWNATDEGAEPSWGMSWPGGRIAANAVRIRYQAGYAVVPKPIVQAVLLMVGDLYSNREASVIDASRVTVVANPTVENLLAPFRILRV